MQTVRLPSFLKRVLAVDALSSGALGLVALAYGSLIAQITDVPHDLLREAGYVLPPFAAFVGWLATRERVNGAAVWIVIAVNAAWVFGSILLIATGQVQPNAFGYAFIIAQAVAVGVFAELEYIGLRMAQAAAAA